MPTVNNYVGGKRLIGTKFYTYYEGDTEATIYRLLKFKESSKKYTLKNTITGEVRVLTEEELCGKDSKFVLLNPDGLMSFTIAKMEDENIKDVFVCIHNAKTTATDFTPLAICRQCAEDIFVNKTAIAQSGAFSIGVSVSIDTCPSNVPYQMFLACKEAIYMATSAVYLDDTIEDFKTYIFPGVNIKKFDTVLATTKAYMEHNGRNTNGSVTTVEDLLKLNNFMHDFHLSFKVHEIELPDFKDGDTQLSEISIYYFKKHLGHDDITNTYVLKYSRDINLKAIKRDYVLVNPIGMDSIYIIGYDTRDDRIFVPHKYMDQG